MAPSPILWGIPDELQKLLAGWVPYAGIFFGLWFATIALTGWLARRRGRDDGLWAVAALFLGPIALVAVMLLPRVAPTELVSSEPSNDPRGGWSETAK